MRLQTYSENGHKVGFLRAPLSDEAHRAYWAVLNRHIEEFREALAPFGLTPELVEMPTINRAFEKED